jgi:hypothetical protein
MAIRFASIICHELLPTWNQSFPWTTQAFPALSSILQRAINPMVYITTKNECLPITRGMILYEPLGWFSLWYEKELPLHACGISPTLRECISVIRRLLDAPLSWCKNGHIYWTRQAHDLVRDRWRKEDSGVSSTGCDAKGRSKFTRAGGNDIVARLQNHEEIEWALGPGQRQPFSAFMHGLEASNVDCSKTCFWVSTTA